MKVAGDRTFDTWTVTVINDVDFNLRTAFQNWMQDIAQYADGSGEADPQVYKSTATVAQLKRRSSNLGQTSDSGLEAAYTYDFFGIFQLTLVLSIFLTILLIRLKNSLLNSKSIIGHLRVLMTQLTEGPASDGN